MNKLILKKYYPILPLLGLCNIFLWKSFTFEIHDFSNYYFGGLFHRFGIFDTQVYFPFEFNSQIKSMGWNNIFVSFAPNTPFLALLFYPFSFLEIHIAKLIFNLISTTLFIISLFRLSQYLQISNKVLLVLPIIFFSPLMNSILFGQVYLLLLFLLIEGFLAYKKNRIFVMAVFWSIAILLKIFPIFLFLLFLIKLDIKAILKFSLVLILLTSCCIMVQGIEIWKFYIFDVLSRASQGEIAGKFVDNYQSLTMFLKRILVFDRLENPNPIFSFNENYYFIYNLIKYLILGVTLWCLNKVLSMENNGKYIGFSLLLLLSLTISPVGSSYALLLLIPILIFLLQKSKNVKVFIVISIFCFFFFNQNLFPFRSFPLNYLRLFGLLLLLGYFYIPYLRLKPIVKVFFISTLLASTKLFEEVPNDTNTLIKSKLPILTYNYSLKKDSVVCFYWDQNGVNQKSFFLQNSFQEDNSQLEVKNNQIYLQGSQVTKEPGNKLKPLWLAPNTISYLSDEDIGIGFYTIKYITLR